MLNKTQPFSPFQNMKNPIIYVFFHELFLKRDVHLSEMQMIVLNCEMERDGVYTMFDIL